MCRLFKNVFSINQDDNFVMYNSAPPVIIQVYNDGDGNGTDPDHLQLDMTGGANSQWNEAVLGMLLESSRRLGGQSGGHSQTDPTAILPT